MKELATITISAFPLSKVLAGFLVTTRSRLSFAEVMAMCAFVAVLALALLEEMAKLLTLSAALAAAFTAFAGS